MSRHFSTSQIRDSDDDLRATNQYRALAETIFGSFRRWFSEGSLETHQRRPVDVSSIILNAITPHSPHRINEGTAPTKTVFGSHPRS